MEVNFPQKMQTQTCHILYFQWKYYCRGKLSSIIPRDKSYFQHKYPVEAKFHLYPYVQFWPFTFKENFHKLEKLQKGVVSLVKKWTAFH